MDKRKAGLLSLILLLVAGFFFFDMGQYLSLDALKAQQAALNAQVAANPWLIGGLFFLAYVAVTALSLPGAALMTLVAGALFGLLGGTVLVSFASTLGATLAMLISRFLLRDWVQASFGQRLATIDQGIAQEGASYLFALRLVPVFPFFLINLAMGLTRLPARTFWWISQVGMLPGTLVYVNAGRELAQLDSLSGILSPGLLGAFVLLGLLPILSRKALEWGKARKVYRGWSKPKHFGPQHGGHRGWLRRLGECLHCCRGEGQSDTHREAQNGRRLPEYRLRAIQGADPLGEDCSRAEKSQAAGIQKCQRRSGFLCGDGTGAAGGQ